MVQKHLANLSNFGLTEIEKICAYVLGKKMEVLPQVNLVSHWLVAKIQAMPPSRSILI